MPWLELLLGAGTEPEPVLGLVLEPRLLQLLAPVTVCELLDQ